MSKRFLVLLVLIAAMMSFTSCSKTNEAMAPESIETRAEKPVVTAPQLISKDTRWTADKVYRLDGKVYVVNKATLTIEAGTKVVGVYKEDPALASALIVTPGSKIMAVGTAANPIVMTAENGQKGGWGGLVILGNAPINQENEQLIEGIDPTKISIPMAAKVYYGSPLGIRTHENESSGRLSYVRVEYAGAEVAPTKELNAFTFGGVGRGTQLDHLQAYYGADDAFEFFGGTVNASYLVSTATDDDAFDFDFGYSGTITYAVSTIDPTTCYSSDPNGIECDNEGDAPYLHTPFTRPVLKYFTIVGTADGKVACGGDKNNLGYLKSGANFRRNTQFDLQNSIICGFPKGILKETNNSFTLLNNVVSSVPAGKEYWDFIPDASNDVDMPLEAPYSNTVAGLQLNDEYAGEDLGAFAHGNWFTSTGRWIRGYGLIHK